jgi:hypothetical protein
MGVLYLILLIVALITQISVNITKSEGINYVDGNPNQFLLQQPVSIQSFASIISKSNECLIKNDKYPKDYLYATKEKENYLVNHNLKDTFMNHFSNKRKVYVYPFTHVNMFDRLRWRIVPFLLNQKNNEKDEISDDEMEKTSNEELKDQKNNFEILNELIEESNMYYFIISTIYDEYLCASSLHTNDLFKTRRLVQAQKLDKKDVALDKSCMWRIEQVKQKYKSLLTAARPSFHIWNVKYNEPLYAASSFFNTNEYGRSIYTWYNKPNSDQFNWNFNCQNSSIKNVIGKYKTNIQPSN